ncbi:MAG: response regulator [Thermoplasmatota archaeon]
MDEEKKKVLCVDDNINLCRTISLVLGRKGFRADMARDGEEALEKVERENYDIILLDIKLPGIDGVETLKRIRDVRKDANVIMMTAYAVEDMVHEALEEGAKGVFYKPMDMDEVITGIEENLECDLSPEDAREAFQ